MSNATKIAVPLLLLAAIAGGAAYYLNHAGNESPPTPQNVPAPALPAAQQPTHAPAPAVAPVPESERVKVNPTSVLSHSGAAQGVRGRVMLPNGSPAGEVQVMLIESGMNDPIKIFLENRSGRPRQALAVSQTTAEGTFELGLEQTSKSVDLRVVSPMHPEINRSQVKVRDNDWYDFGDLQLEQGLVVTGRVVEAASKAPVAQATVFLSGTQQSHAMVATPGRERGVVATTEGNGAFSFMNAPRQGLINLVVEAQGYATAQLLNQVLKPEGNDFTIEVEVGQPISGVVVDPDGKPIAGATVTATGLSSKTPQTATITSDTDGSFEFPSLRTGPYQLLATSSQYAEGKNGMVMTGDSSVKLVLSLRAMVKLGVLGANKAPVKSYRISLKRYFANNPQQIGNVPEFADRSVNPGDYPADLGGQWALIRGLPAGEFRFQIEERGHAKTLSQPFTIVEGGPVVEVVAQLTLGASITGTLIDGQGKPVAGATVTTDLNGGIAADSPIFDIFRSMMPEKHSKAQTTSDGQGRFRINKLAFADYMVRASHPDYCEGTVINLTLETEGQVLDAGVIQMSTGAILEGFTMVGGAPAGQVKVAISSPMSESPAGADRTKVSRPMFNANVISDGDGHFRILKRVPPGTYKATASRSNTNSPFDTLMDMKETEQTVEIAPGRDKVELTFNLTKR